MKKLLIICGATGVGKTKLGIYLAKKFNGEIISSDSRQVYKYMDIGTGKEWDETGEVKIHGYDLVEPSYDYSVFEFFKFAKKTIEDIWSRNKLPIAVGGTGFYIKSITGGIETLDVPKNVQLRKELENYSTDQLFEKLAVLDGGRAAKLNFSDKKNKRRLIRAIEIAIWNLENSKNRKIIKKKSKLLANEVDFLRIGLAENIDILKNRLETKIEDRINKGFIEEIESLLRKGISWKNQSMRAIGYKEAEDFLKKGLTYEEFLRNWLSSEMKYIKRQITWFKKDRQIKWFNVGDLNLHQRIEKIVRKWYDM